MGLNSPSYGSEVVSALFLKSLCLDAEEKNGPYLYILQMHIQE